MIKLTRDTDSIFPYGLRGTPFSVVFSALQQVAGEVWDIDPRVYRSAIAWGYYLEKAPELLIESDAGRDFLTAVLVSEQVPLIKDTQTIPELADLLKQWRDYVPTFERLESLYIPYAARVEVRPSTDPEASVALPLENTNGAFYIILTEIDWSRPLTLGEARTIAMRATPMGAQPHVLYFFEETTKAYARPVYGDVTVYVIETELPEPAPEPQVGFYFAGNFTTGDDIPADSVDGGQGYLDHYLVVTPLCESRGWAAGGNLNMAYFTSNGAEETQNTELDYYESYRLYDENGNAITYRAINEKYRITSAFRINKGSSAALWNQSDLNTWLKLQQVGQMFAYTEEESGMPSDTDIYSLMYSISPSITVLLGLRYDGNDWLSKTFDTDDFWWSGILSEEDKTLIESIGLRTSVMFYGYGGTIGSIEYNAGYDYKILGLYSDINGTQEVQTDLSNLFVAPHTPTGDSTQYAAICNHTAITTPSMTWKVRITPKGTSVVVAYKADGTTSNGVQNGNKYIITDVDSNWHSEAELNALGWYVQWNLYTFSAYSSLNIRNTPSLSTSYVIAKWPQTETLVGNPYLEQTVDGRVWQTVKFTLNGGATVQTGYCIVDSQVPVTHTTGTAQTDILTAENP